VDEVDDASADAQDADESLDAQDGDESLDVTMGAELLEDAAPIAELDDQDASSTTGALPELVDAPAEDEVVSAPVPTPYFDEGDDVEAGLVNDETDELR
jgi:hypothetical protein